MRGFDAIAVVVGGHHADVISRCLQPIRLVIHEHQLDAGLRGPLEGMGSRDCIDRDTDDHVRMASQQRFDIGRLLFRLELGISHGNHVDTHSIEGGFQPVNLCLGPVVAGIVHRDGSRITAIPNLLQFGFA
ncbi:Uncharacterised protein [Klebsiella quasipneumoniae]|nr:Uncharacterised protein [Klebsiella quasipneumoniae]